MNQFIFYKSFYEAISNLPKENRCEVYEMICEYCFNGKEPEEDGISKAMFVMMKANIDSANKRYLASVENGKKGGAPKGNQNAKKQSKNNLDLTQKQPKNNHNNNINKNKNNNNNINNNKKEKINKKEIELEFEEIWKYYPRKIGKSDSLKKYIQAREIGTSKEQILNAVINYAEEVKNTNPKYIKHGSTWFNGKYWNDEIIKKETEEERIKRLEKEIEEEEKRKK